MGHLRYGRDEIEVEDRLLVHLQVVVTQKMRRHEGFVLTVPHSRAGEKLTSSLWVNASSDVHFAFAGSRQAQTNPRWLELMMEATHSTSGLDVDRVAEPTV